MSVRRSAVLAVWVLAALAARAGAQPASDTATLTANIATIAKLSLSTTSVTFVDADPDTTPQIPALGGPLSITAKARATGGAQVVLTVQATDDLRSGLDTIGAPAITWTTTGTGFVGGTLSKSSSVRVAQWNGSGVRTGTQTLLFANLWTYPTGTVLGVPGLHADRAMMTGLFASLAPGRRAFLAALVGCALACGAAPASAQGRAARPKTKLNLKVSPAAISFASSDPDTVPQIAAPPLTVQIRVRQNTGSWQLTVLADGDLISGANTVDITNVTWTATPAPPFQNGTLSRTVAQRVASGTGNVNPATNGALIFRLANSWNYAAGIYSQTLVFTLSAP